jgi:hypothetical protein
MTKGKQMPHPTYNPNLVLNTFFLFSDIKVKPSEYNISNLENVRKAIINIFNEIEQEILINVFEGWI